MRRIIAIALAAIMLLTLAACGAAPQNETQSTAENIPGSNNNVLTVGMECAYAPYNWTQIDDSNGAVPIVNSPGTYANGYDVMIAKRIADYYGWDLEIMALEWDGLHPALNAGTIDVAIAGQSMTAERAEQVDFAGPYLYASIVCLAKADSALASAQGISELSGTCTSQRGTIWYDTCLPQIEGADIQTAQDTAPAMLMAVNSKTVDFVCTDMPTAQGAVVAYPDLMILDFSANAEDNFEVSDEEVNIGISVRDGNTTLLEAMNKVLDPMTADDFNAMMAEAVAIQPIEE